MQLVSCVPLDRGWALEREVGVGVATCVSWRWHLFIGFRLAKFRAGRRDRGRESPPPHTHTHFVQHFWCTPSIMLSPRPPPSFLLTASQAPERQESGINTCQTAGRTARILLAVSHRQGGAVEGWAAKCPSPSSTFPDNNQLEMPTCRQANLASHLSGCESSPSDHPLPLGMHRATDNPLSPLCSLPQSFLLLPTLLLIPTGL